MALALAACLGGCTATPLPLPPELDSKRLELGAAGNEQVRFAGGEGALEPAGEWVLLVRNLARGAAVGFSTAADGSFVVGLPGLLGERYRFDLRLGGELSPLLECTSDGRGGVLDLSTEPEVDADGDGFGDGVDCDDADPAVNPLAPELCDGVDNDCDGASDEDCGDPCLSNDDCDDSDPATVDACIEGLCRHEPSGCFPVAEVCNGLDDDCDGLADEGCPACVNDFDCDDGLFCDGEEVCLGSLCVGGAAISCDDGDPATLDYCSELEARCVAE